MVLTATLPARTTADASLDMVRAEFREMPGMRLTRAQMRRLWQFDGQTCDWVVRYLIAEGFLEEDQRGHLHWTGPQRP